MLTLRLPYEKEMIHYNTVERLSGTSMGDTRSFHKHNEPVVDYVDRWKRDLNSSVTRQIARKYIAALGSSTFDFFGYDYGAALDALGKPSKSEKWALFDVGFVIDPHSNPSFLNKLYVFSLRLRRYASKRIRRIVGFRKNKL